MKKLIKLYLTLAALFAGLVLLLDDSPRKWTRDELLFDIQCGLGFPVLAAGLVLYLLGGGD